MTSPRSGHYCQLECDGVALRAAGATSHSSRCEQPAKVRWSSSTSQTRFEPHRMLDETQKVRDSKFRKMAMWNVVIRWVGLSGWREYKRVPPPPRVCRKCRSSASWRSLNVKGSLTARSYLCTTNRTSPNQSDRTFLRRSWRWQRTYSSADRVVDILVDPTSIR